MSFTDKVAIVTGASAGLGAAAALALAKEGAKVAIVARNGDKLNQVAKQCEENGPKPLIIIADVSRDEEAKNIVKKTVETFGQLDILINNAGVVGLSSMLDEEIINYFDLVVNTNLRATVHLTCLSAPHLIKTKGNVINISSVAGVRVPGKNYMCYAVSKAGVDHFTRCAALDLSQYGVRVNSINPGPVNTDIVVNAGAPNPDKIWETFKGNTALKKISEPEEVADLVLFLASDKARSITGSSIVIDNGLLVAK
ncbi:uncharacterized oxidoreductase TM_0325-like [Leguminivora glycinivorella]|uniref:uncharacterized oxidoreductase TM_0325-like n=1 Tax=Leguminivora glycinivorella TaxID=1035111 RepID=UPI00200EE092|nr:uncharacterized oxidoreductase TM_0325-like [Leguminivora glycinivorella]